MKTWWIAGLIVICGCPKAKEEGVTWQDCRAMAACRSLGQCTPQGKACIAAGDDCQNTAACRNDGKCLPAGGACAAGGEPPEGSPRAAAIASAAASARHGRIESYRAWTRKERASSAANSGDKQMSGVVAMELVEACEDDEEKADVAGIYTAHLVAAGIPPGSPDTMARDPSAPSAARGLAPLRIRHIKTLKRSSAGEAAKDPQANRGRWIEVSGAVVEIRKEGNDLFSGLIASSFPPAYVTFVTAGKTDGLVAGSRAAFCGVFLQEYAFENVSGGQTRSLVLAGHFKGQGMD